MTHPELNPRRAGALLSLGAIGIAVITVLLAPHITAHTSTQTSLPATPNVIPSSPTHSPELAPHAVHTDVWSPPPKQAVLSDNPHIPALASLPGAPVTVVLDFGGHTLVPGDRWHGKFAFAEHLPVRLPAATHESYPETLSSADITNVWRQVAEDFAPWNVNVTTLDVPDTYIHRSAPDDPHFGARVGIVPRSGHYSYRSREDDYERIGTGAQDLVNFPIEVQRAHHLSALAWTNTDTSLPSVADAITHEVGHVFGLTHAHRYTYHEDGDIAEVEKYFVNKTTWTALMGAAVENIGLSIWHNNSHPDAVGHRDPLAQLDEILTRRAQDTAAAGKNNPANALPLDHHTAVRGVLTSAQDRDTYTVTVDKLTPHFDITVETLPRPNVNIAISVYHQDTNTQILDSFSVDLDTEYNADTQSTDVIGSGINGRLRWVQPGQYTITIEPATITGDDTYGSLGNYRLTVGTPISHHRGASTE